MIHNVRSRRTMRKTQFGIDNRVIIAIFAVLTCTMSASTSARAQSFGTARILRPRLEQTAEKARSTQVSFSPALFLGVDNRREETKSVGAAVLGVEHGLLAGKNPLQLGAFLYTQGGGDSTIAQFQAKYYFTDSIGIQAGWLTGTKNSGSGDKTAFGLYNLSSRRYDKATRFPWDLQVGLGGYFPGNKGTNSPNAFSGYVQFSFSLSPAVTINTSYWGIDTGQDSSVNRFLIGAGYNF